MPDTSRLMQLARQRLDEGALPELAGNTTLGGLSAGARCRLCGEAILAGRPEIEVQWIDDGVPRSVTLHPPCHAAWLTVASPESMAS